MANIKYRLRRRQNGIIRMADVIDLTQESAPVPPQFIEVIDLTVCGIKVESSSMEPERLADFRQSLFAAFHRRRKQSMSLLRLARCVNVESKENFSKKEVDSALTQMADGNELFISNGMVHLV